MRFFKWIIVCLIFITVTLAQNYNDVNSEYRSNYKDSYLTFKAGGAYNLWFPSQPEKADISTTGYAGYYLKFTCKFKNWFRLYQFKYEAENNIEPPETKKRDQLIRETAGRPAYYVYNFLSDFLSIKKFNNMSIILRATGEDFKSVVKFEGNVTYQPYNIREEGRIYYYYAGDKAHFYTRFEDKFFGAAFGKSNERLYIGVGSLSYQKPYALTIGQNSIDDVIHDAKFTATTIGCGLELKPKIQSNGGLSISAFLHGGPGEIELIYKEISISQIAEKFNCNVQYLGFDTEIKYIKPIYKDSIFIGGTFSATGKTFKLQDPDDINYEDMESMNTDIIIGIKGFIHVLF